MESINERIDGLIHLSELEKFKEAIKNITLDLYKAEGFEKEDILPYLVDKLREQIKHTEV